MSSKGLTAARLWQAVEGPPPGSLHGDGDSTAGPSGPPDELADFVWDAHPPPVPALHVSPLGPSLDTVRGPCLARGPADRSVALPPLSPNRLKALPPCHVSEASPGRPRTKSNGSLSASPTATPTSPHKSPALLARSPVNRSPVPLTRSDTNCSLGLARSDTNGSVGLSRSDTNGSVGISPSLSEFGRQSAGLFGDEFGSEGLDAEADDVGAASFTLSWC
eukprot:gene5109-916_t